MLCYCYYCMIFGTQFLIAVRVFLKPRFIVPDRQNYPQGQAMGRGFVSFTLDSSVTHQEREISL